MRYKLGVLLILTIIGVALMIYLPNFVFRKNWREDFVFYELDNKKLKLLVADEPKEWEQGLMFVRKSNLSCDLSESLPNKLLELSSSEFGLYSGKSLFGQHSGCDDLYF